MELLEVDLAAQQGLVAAPLQAALAHATLVTLLLLLQHTARKERQLADLIFAVEVLLHTAALGVGHAPAEACVATDVFT